MELVSLKNWPNKDDIVGYLQYVDEYVSELERNLEQADESKNNDEEKARLSKELNFAKKYQIVLRNSFEDVALKNVNVVDNYDAATEYVRCVKQMFVSKYQQVLHECDALETKIANANKMYSLELDEGEWSRVSYSSNAEAFFDEFMDADSFIKKLINDKETFADNDLVESFKGASLKADKAWKLAKLIIDIRQINEGLEFVEFGLATTKSILEKIANVLGSPEAKEKFCRELQKKSRSNSEFFKSLSDTTRAKLQSEDMNGETFRQLKEGYQIYLDGGDFLPKMASKTATEIMKLESELNLKKKELFNLAHKVESFEHVLDSPQELEDFFKNEIREREKKVPLSYTNLNTLTSNMSKSVRLNAQYYESLVTRLKEKVATLEKMLNSFYDDDYETLDAQRKIRGHEDEILLSRRIDDALIMELRRKEQCMILGDAITRLTTCQRKIEDFLSRASFFYSYDRKVLKYRRKYEELINSTYEKLKTKMLLESGSNGLFKAEVNSFEEIFNPKNKQDLDMDNWLYALYLESCRIGTFDGGNLKFETFAFCLSQYNDLLDKLFTISKDGGFYSFGITRDDLKILDSLQTLFIDAMQKLKENKSKEYMRLIKIVSRPVSDDLIKLACEAGIDFSGLTRENVEDKLEDTFKQVQISEQRRDEALDGSKAIVRGVSYEDALAYCDMLQGIEEAGVSLNGVLKYAKREV